MIPRVALGQGFFGACRPRVSDAHVHPVDVSNGMPIVSHKKPIVEWPKKLKKGRFTKYCKRQGHDGPNAACAKKAMASKDSSVRGMASFYMNTVKPGGKTASSVKSDGKKK